MRALVKYETLLSADLLVRADRVRAQLRRAAAAAFESFDLLVWPTVPAPAPPIERPVVELPSGEVPADGPNVRQTGFGNLTGLPGVNLPVGIHSSGLPMGLQLQAAWGGEALLLDAAEHLEEASGRRHVDATPPIAEPAPA
jgi:Asp-tRNA(Asn)/Glu-tRNA(Gln) amidotransferase A subunit family amidase